MSDAKLGTLIVGGFVGVIAALVGGSIAYDSWACGRRWGGSGMATTWGPVQGCQVEVSPGRFIPEDRVREVDLQPRGVK